MTNSESWPTPTETTVPDQTRPRADSDPATCALSVAPDTMRSMSARARFCAPAGQIQFLVTDLETTGVDLSRDRIVEIAAVALTADLEQVFTFRSLVRLNAYGRRRIEADGFVHAMHHGSGLLDDLAQPGLPTLRAVERDLVDLLDAHDAPTGGVTLAGSGVGRLDLPMIRVQMPALAARLYHSPLDIGAARRHYLVSTGSMLTDVNESKSHRAMDDVGCHIEEIRRFRDLYLDHAQRRTDGGADAPATA